MPRREEKDYNPLPFTRGIFFIFDNPFPDVVYPAHHNKFRLTYTFTRLLFRFKKNLDQIMKRQDYLFQQPIKVAGETIKGIALSTQEIAHLQTLPAGKSASIGFVLDGSPSFVSRTCHIIKCEQPERTDESISENCLKFFFLLLER